jgi:uncharacterized membrane protein YeiH
VTGGYTLLVADLIGLAVFAASGASAAAAKRLNLFGVGFIAALGGGICMTWGSARGRRWRSPIGTTR